MEEPQKLFRLPGTIDEEEEDAKDAEVALARPGPAMVVEGQPRVDSPLLGQRNTGTVSSLPRNVTLFRVSTQSSSIGGVTRQDSTRSRYRAGPTRKLRRRAVLKNGECNVLQSRISRRSLRFLQDIFTTLVDTQWRWTLLCFTLSFLLSWLGFAVIWWLIAFTHGDFEERHLPPFQIENNWTPCIYNIFSFTSCFLFSIETQHTIGYGGRSTTEECPEAIFVMCLQSIAGVMIQAFMVGIVFAKMSRPKQRTQTLLFSRNAVICQRDGELCLMFRVGDMRKSHIIGAAVRAQLIRTRTTKEGEVLSQNQQELAVGTDGQNGNLFFIWPTTIVHKINAESPFYNMSAEDMLTERFEVVAILEGTIESTGQTTQARSSYLPQEILWGHRFEPMVTYSKERQGYEVDYSLFNSTSQVDTPLCSGRELAEFYKVQEELRQGTGMIVDEDFLTDTCQEVQSHCGYPPGPYVHGYYQRPHPVRMNSSRSENSSAEYPVCRFACRNPNCGVPTMTTEETCQRRHTDDDPDGIQVMGEGDLEQLPEAVNQEIVKNSKEIVYEDTVREFRFPPVDEFRAVKRNGVPGSPVQQPTSPFDHRKPSNATNGGLYQRNILLGSRDEAASSPNGSRRSFNGLKKKYLYLVPREALETRLPDNRDSPICWRRQALAGLKRNPPSLGRVNTGTPETAGGGRCRDAATLEIETRRRRSAPKLHQETRQNEGSLSDANASPAVYRATVSPLKCPRSPVSPETSPISEFSPESGFYEANQWSSSPESNRKEDHQLPGDELGKEEAIVAMHRRSYQTAQLEDVNQALDRTSPDDTSSTSSSSSVCDGYTKDPDEDVRLLTGRQSKDIPPIGLVPFTSV